MIRSKKRLKLLNNTFAVPCEWNQCMQWFLKNGVCGLENKLKKILIVPTDFAFAGIETLPVGDFSAGFSFLSREFLRDRKHEMPIII